MEGDVDMNSSEIRDSNVPWLISRCFRLGSGVDTVSHSFDNPLVHALHSKGH